MMINLHSSLLQTKKNKKEKFKVNMKGCILKLINIYIEREREIGIPIERKGLFNAILVY